MNQTPIIHKYILHEKLGKGCFSSVFKGIHKVSGKTVAIKIESDAAPMNMLKRESKILSYLNKELASTNRWLTPTLFWYGLYGEHICMATSFYQKTLSSYIDDLWATNKPNVVIELALISYQIIEIFQHIHGVFILHCDIKPDNFMINEAGKVVLIDFGLACLYVESGDTTKHRHDEPKEHIIGTPKYASYFLHDGHTPARRDDMISIGYMFVTLFGIDLPWSNCETEESEYPIYHIMHPHNIIRKRLKSPDQIFTYLQLVKLRKTIVNNYLIPYLANVYRIGIMDSPDYYSLKGLFSTLY
jgi:casein kinase I family protein HRR25